MTAPLDDGSPSRYEQDRTWITGSVGGPVIPSKLFFYGSYYRPEVQRDNRANNYGELPEYKRTRDEGFGKLTFTPTSSVLLNVSYRGSDRTRPQRLVRRERVGHDWHGRRSRTRRSASPKARGSSTRAAS